LPPETGNRSVQLRKDALEFNPDHMLL